MTIPRVLVCIDRPHLIHQRMHMNSAPFRASEHPAVCLKCCRLRRAICSACSQVSYRFAEIPSPVALRCALNGSYHLTKLALSVISYLHHLPIEPCSICFRNCNENETTRQTTLSARTELVRPDAPATRFVSPMLSPPLQNALHRCVHPVFAHRNKTVMPVSEPCAISFDQHKSSDRRR